MKNMAKLVGIIFIMAVIVFSVVSCDDDSKEEVKIYTVSLDKVNSRTFTITLEGGKWKHRPEGAVDFSSVILGCLNTSLLADIGEYKGQRISIYDFNEERISDTTIIFRLKDNNYSGLPILDPDGIIEFLDNDNWYYRYNTLGVRCINDFIVGKTKVVSNTEKKKITF